MLRFAKDCVDDRKYQEASLIYEWNLGDGSVCRGRIVDPADLEVLVEKEIVTVDLKQLALLTLYVDYQVREPEERRKIYIYIFHIMHFMIFILRICSMQEEKI